MSFVDVTVIAVALSACVAFIRFAIGPSLSDRAMALDTISVGVVAIMVLLSFIFDRAIYLDIAIVYGLVGFMGTLLIGRFLEGGL